MDKTTTEILLDFMNETDEVLYALKKLNERTGNYLYKSSEDWENFRENLYKAKWSLSEAFKNIQSATIKAGTTTGGEKMQYAPVWRKDVGKEYK